MSRASARAATAGGRATAASSPAAPDSDFALTEADEADSTAHFAALLQAQTKQQQAQTVLLTELHDKIEALEARAAARSPASASVSPQQPRTEPAVPRAPSVAASEATTASASSTFADTLSEAVGEEPDPLHQHDITRRHLGPRWQVALYGARAKKHHLSVHELEHLNLFSGVYRAWSKSMHIINAALADSEDPGIQRTLQDVAELYYAMEPEMQLFVTEKTLKLSYPPERVEPVMEALRSNMDVRDSSTSHVEGIPLALPDAGRTLAEFKTKEASEVLRRFGSKAPTTPAAKAAADELEVENLRRKLKTLQDTHATVKRDLLKAVPDWKPKTKDGVADKGTSKAAKTPKGGARAGTPPPEGGGGP